MRRKVLKRLTQHNHPEDGKVYYNRGGSLRSRIVHMYGGYSTSRPETRNASDEENQSTILAVLRPALEGPQHHSSFPPVPPPHPACGFYTSLRRVITQKTEDFISTAEEVLDHE